jgi:hypothetical protein
MNFNPFLPFGLDQNDIEDVIKMTPETIVKLYRQRARQLHPDKAGGDTQGFQALEQAKVCLTTSRQMFLNYAGTWLLTRREKEVRARNNALVQETRQAREASYRDQASTMDGRQEAMPGIVLVQGTLSQVFRSNQRVARRGSTGSTE